MTIKVRINGIGTNKIKNIEIGKVDGTKDLEEGVSNKEDQEPEEWTILTDNVIWVYGIKLQEQTTSLSKMITLQQ